MALLLTGGVLALAGAGCGGSDKITPVSDSTGSPAPKSGVGLSGVGGFASLQGKSGKGGNGGNDGSGGGNGFGDFGGGHGGKHNGNGNGNGNGDDGNSKFFRSDGNPKTSSDPGNLAGAIDCKADVSNDSGNSSDCVATSNCTNVHLPGPECCPFPIPSDEGGRHKNSNGDCPQAESSESKSSSGKRGKDDDSSDSSGDGDRSSDQRAKEWLDKHGDDRSGKRKRD